jgi:predicted nucleic acid-binding protein
MTPVFADTFYWYGLANRRDQWHPFVVQARANLGNRPVVTTDEVLTEFLAAMSGDAFLRAAGSLLVSAILADPAVTVLPQTHATFLAGLELYNRRPDKHYSLTDCISMNACQQEGITEVLTNDHHFAREGFVVLIQKTE